MLRKFRLERVLDLGYVAVGLKDVGDRVVLIPVTALARAITL
jgi:hypothetical protein